MTPERWRRIVELFEGALARPEDARAAWLAAECGGDQALGREVERLLEADRGAGAFLGGPAGAGGGYPGAGEPAGAGGGGEAGPPPAGMPGDGDATTVLPGRPSGAAGGAGTALGAAPARAAFGRYEVVERIGGGGFSEVFRGRDPVLGRPVAIKVCRWASPEVRRRFAREAEIVARLDHPNLTTVYDFGLDGDAAFLVQELLGGEDLQRLLERPEPPPLAARLDLLLQVARGLAYAHERGVVHRDIKPSNLRVEADGRIKIMDFGIAALTGDATRLTQAGTVLGTAAYMAPEQIRGEPAGPRADVYSFGAVAYELLAGRPPYRAESVPGLLYQLLHGELEPLAAAAPDCPPALAALVERCLARDPAERPEGFAEVIAGLAAVAAGLDPAAAAAGASPWAGSAGAGGAGDTRAEPPRRAAPHRARGRRRGRRSALAATAATAAALALAAWLARGRFASGGDGADPGGLGAPAAAPGPAPASALGLLAIDARPWAEVVALRDAAGAEHPLPAEPITPLAVALPPGEYTVTLRHPRSAAPRECSARVAAGATADCRAVFARIDARAFVARMAPP